MLSKRRVAVPIVAAMLAGCAAGAPKLPYPSFIQTDDLPDVFLAELPGVRAKRYVSDAGTRSGSYRIDLPASWQGTSGASPGKSLEIFVLAGELSVADIDLRRGGYAYLPPGTLGFNMTTGGGARVLYFLDDVDATAMIRTPLILDSSVVDWQPAGEPGISVKELRADPGSGARTWLLRIDPGTRLSWEVSSSYREGYLVAGRVTHSECAEGKVRTGDYVEGGYFYRPPNTISGGPDAGADTAAVWFLREAGAPDVRTVPACVATSTDLTSTDF